MFYLQALDIAISEIYTVRSIDGALNVHILAVSDHHLNRSVDLDEGIDSLNFVVAVYGVFRHLSSQGELCDCLKEKLIMVKAMQHCFIALTVLSSP